MFALAGDKQASRLHARLERSGGSWTIYDGGLSRNGTFLNGERVHGHRVLNDPDQLRFEKTEVCFRDTSPQRSRIVIVGAERAGPVAPAATEGACDLVPAVQAPVCFYSAGLHPRDRWRVGLECGVGQESSSESVREVRSGRSAADREADVPGRAGSNKAWSATPSCNGLR